MTKKKNNESAYFDSLSEVPTPKRKQSTPSTSTSVSYMNLDEHNPKQFNSSSSYQNIEMGEIELKNPKKLASNESYMNLEIENNPKPRPSLSSSPSYMNIDNEIEKGSKKENPKTLPTGGSYVDLGNVPKNENPKTLPTGSSYVDLGNVPKNAKKSESQYFDSLSDIPTKK